MYKKILVPLDGSKRAEAILPQVEDLAHCFEAKIILLNVIEPIRMYSSFQGYIPDYESVHQKQMEGIKDTELYLKGLVGEFREKNISAKLIVDEGLIVSTIIQVAEREGVDMIAMSSHGRTGLSRVFYGSVAAGVLNQTNRPLLLIRADGADK
jgi:nucleotide-binding universal stress UspA family protein